MLVSATRLLIFFSVEGKSFTTQENVKNLLEELRTELKTDDPSQEEVISASPPHSSPFRKRRKRIQQLITKVPNIRSMQNNVSFIYDLKNKFSPKPGSSKDIAPTESPPKSVSGVESCYDKSFEVNSPQLFSTDSSVKSLSQCPLSDETVILTPSELPPNFFEVDKDCLHFKIEEYSYQEPFFSKSEDIVQKRQVGYNILQIPGNTLNDVMDFESSLPNLIGINSYRCEVLSEVEGSLVANKFKSYQAVKEYISSGKQVIIRPLEEAPTFKNCCKWLKSREDNINQEGKRALDQDSPIAVKRQKVIMIVDNELSESPCNPTLTPLTCDSNDKTIGVSIFAIKYLKIFESSVKYL